MTNERITQPNDCSHEHRDAILVARVLAGDREAFDLLFQRYAPSVRRMCSTLLGSTTEGEDIAQEAVLQAFLGLAHLRQPSHFGAWLHSIASNLAHSALRRRSEKSLEQLGEEVIPPLLWLDPQPTPDEYLLEREVQEAVHLAIQELPLTHRQAVVGFYLHGYHYEELAERLGIPLSTLKWRLFESRKLLKAHLQPFAQTIHHPMYSAPPRCLSDGLQRKGTSMSNNAQRKRTTGSSGGLVVLRLDSLQRFPFTRQRLAILRDPDNSRVLPVVLTDAEFDVLHAAFRGRRESADERLVPQTLAERLLDSFGADLEKIVINALAGQTLYATVTLKQGTRSRAVDMRLSEALLLAVQDDVPILIERALLEAAPTCESTLLTGPLSEIVEDLLARGQAVQQPGREDRLQREEAVQRKVSAAQYLRSMRSWERLWEMLLISLRDSLDAMPGAKRRSLDLGAYFPTRQVTWDGQSMTAVRLPEHPEASWLVVSPRLWEQITQEWHRWREVGHDQEQEPVLLAATPIPDTLTPQLQHQAEQMLAQLAELPDVRAAFMINPAGTVAACTGEEPLERVQRYYDETSHRRSGPFLSSARDLGVRGQSVQVILYTQYEAHEQEHPAPPGTDWLLTYHHSGWRLGIFYDTQRDDAAQAQINQRVEEVWRELVQQLEQQMPS